MNAFKISIGLMVFALSFSIATANEIDSIKTDSDVNVFMEKHFGEKYKQFMVADTNFIWYSYSKTNSLSLVADTLGMKFWYKADFNNDSMTDLLVYGSFILGEASEVKKASILVIIDTGNENYQIILLYSRFGPPFPVVIKRDSEFLVLLYKPYLKRIQNDIIELDKYHRVTPEYDYSVTHHRADTLIYKFGDFVEYNSNPLRNEIIEITAKNSCGMLACYVMDIQINKDGFAEMLGGEYYEDKIRYKSQIDSETLNKIFGLINYINPKRFLSKYSARNTEASSVVSTYTYADGTVKKIEDYWRSELGLKRLYDLVFALKDNQHWEEVE